MTWRYRISLRTKIERRGDSVTDLILAVVRLLERDINQLVVEARETLELVKL